MIPLSQERLQISAGTAAACGEREPAERWQTIVSESALSPAELAERLHLAPESISQRAANAFALVVPRPYLERIRPGDPGDPLLLQVLADPLEVQETPGFVEDPLEEQAAIRTNGMIQRFAGRALVTVTSACAIHCRYCFRRHFPYASEVPDRGAWERIFAQVASDRSITEVVLSGGDPLALRDHHLEWILDGLDAIAHVRRIRLHTRFPVAIPQRVTDSLLALVQGVPGKLVIVIHANHPQEIDQEVSSALDRLRACNITLLNQSVLLKGVNDDAETLSALSETLFSAGVIPYYLHMLDPVAGAAHFAVADEHAVAISRALRAMLPGYLVPRLVRDLPGAAAKLPVG